MAARNNRACLFPLCTRRSCVVPTWRGWLLLLCLAVALLTFAVRGVYSFLAPNDPVPGGILVVEGWAGDDVLAGVIDEFKRNHYDGLFVTGGPLDKGAPLSEYKTYPELTVATLVKMGFDPKRLHAVPSGAVEKDRTYSSAMALKVWLRAHGMAASRINVISVGPHARRTRYLFQKTFGDSAKVGVLAFGEAGFDPKRWWASSQGFRSVTGEMLAYLYARLLFCAPKD